MIARRVALPHRLMRLDWSLGLLTGGLSRRLGRDKALEPFGRHTLIEWVIERTKPGARAVLLSIRHPTRRLPESCAAYSRVVDVAAEPDAGALAGIVALLDAATSEWLVVVPNDMPGLAARHLEALVAAGIAQPADRVYYRLDEDQPLPLAIRVSVRQHIFDAFRRGERKVLGPLPAIADLALDGACMWPSQAAGLFANVNTAADLLAARAELVPNRLADGTSNP